MQQPEIGSVTCGVCHSKECYCIERTDDGNWVEGRREYEFDDPIEELMFQIGYPMDADLGWISNAKRDE